MILQLLVIFISWYHIKIYETWKYFILESLQSFIFFGPVLYQLGCAELFYSVLYCDCHRYIQWKEPEKNCWLDYNVHLCWGVSSYLLSFRFEPSQVCVLQTSRKQWKYVVSSLNKPCLLSSLSAWLIVVSFSLLHYQFFFQDPSVLIVWSWWCSSYVWSGCANFYRPR